MFLSNNFFYKIQIFDNEEFDCRTPEEWLALGYEEGSCDCKPVPAKALLPTKTTIPSGRVLSEVFFVIFVVVSSKNSYCNLSDMTLFICLTCSGSKEPKFGVFLAAGGSFRIQSGKEPVFGAKGRHKWTGSRF